MAVPWTAACASWAVLVEEVVGVEWTDTVAVAEAGSGE